MTRQTIRYLRRGAVIEMTLSDPALTLLEHLRVERREVGTKEGCNEGDCGACTVVLARVRDGELVHEPVNSCILFAGQIEGAELITVEDIAADGALHPVQRAMVDNHGSQCGFCTPGIVMSLFALYQDGSRPVEFQTICDQLAGNLCRCTGYRPIVAAAKAACADAAGDRFALRRDQRMKALAGLSDEADAIFGDQQRFFAAPRDLDSLASLLMRHPEATIVAGATDVGLWATKKLLDLPKVIWLGRVRDLDLIVDRGDELEFGATVTLSRMRESLASLDPDLGEMMRRFGSMQVRASGTVGGNIANGSPIGDLAPCLIALGATLVLQKGEETRVTPLEDFFLGYGKQDRRPSEFVRAVRAPKLKDHQRFRCFKVSKRFDEDISTVLGAFRFDLRRDRIETARIAFGGMAAIPKRGAATEAALAGANLNAPVSWEAAIEALALDYQPIDDMRASAAYRLSTARALLQKAMFELSAAPTRMTRILGHREPAQEAAE